MSGWLRRTLEIVMMETPRSRAMSFIRVVIEELSKEKIEQLQYYAKPALALIANFIDYAVRSRSFVAGFAPCC